MQRSLTVFVIVVGLFLQSSCGVAAEATLNPSQQPTPTSLPTYTQIPLPTFTPTVTPTPRLPVLSGTSMPPSSSPISTGNIDQIVELARWGKGVITDTAYSPDGTLLAIGSTLGISIYQVDTLDEKLYFETDARVNSVIFSPDGKTLVTGLDDNKVKIWSADDGTLLNTLQGHIDENAKEDAEEPEITSVALSTDGNLLAAGSTDGTISLWQVSDNSLVNTLDNHNLAVSSVFFSPDGRAFFSASRDGTVRMMNISDGSLIQGFGAQSIVDATVSADGKTLAALNEADNFFQTKRDIVLWDVESGKKLRSIQEGEEYSSNYISSIALSPDGQFVAGAWQNHTAKIWSIATGTPQNTFEDLKPKDGWYYLVAFTVTFSNDGKSLLLAGSNIFGIWDINKGTLLNSATTKSERVYDIALSPDGTMLGSVEGPNINLIRVANGGLQPYKEIIQSNNNIAFSPDGMTLITSMFDDTARLWPLSDEGMRRTVEMEKKAEVTGIAVSPEGTIIALGSTYPAGKVELRQISDGALLQILTLDSTFGPIWLVFSPDGKYLAASIYRHIAIFQVSDGKRIGSFKGYGSLAFSPDSTLLAGIPDEKTVNIWKVPGNETLSTFKELPAEVDSMAFSPDGSLLFMGMEDGMINVILMSDGTTLKSWKSHSEGVSDLLFSSDANMLFSSSFDGTIRAWGLKP
jgi:WD40 repeat protein